MGQDPDKVTKIDHISVRSSTTLFSRNVADSIGTIMTITEKCMDNPIAQWVDGQLGNPEKIFTCQIAFLLFIQTSKSAP